jgi:hypothetical protein
MVIRNTRRVTIELPRRATIRPSVNLGPLTRQLVNEGAAIWGDSYPAWQSYADECERLLSFLAARQELDRFRPRLVSRRQQRDEALNEIRVAYFLDRSGCPVVGWEVTDAAPYNVEFEVSLGQGANAFVEAKSPGWEAELSRLELDQGRAKQEKYAGIESRAASPIEVIRRTVKKALPKFTGNAPSLIVIADDCYVNLGEWGWGPPMMALIHRSLGYGDGLFRNPDYSKVGAVCLFWERVSDTGVNYASICIANPNAMPSAALPAEVAAGIRTEPAPDLTDLNLPWL